MTEIIVHATPWVQPLAKGGDEASRRACLNANVVNARIAAKSPALGRPPRYVYDAESREIRLLC